jgi:hypothetical protein
MPREYQPVMTTGGGRRMLSQVHGLGLKPVVMGDQAVLAYEGTAGAAALVTLGEPVRTLWVWCEHDVYVAKSAEALTAAADGSRRDARARVPAKSWRELPWYQDEVHVQAVGTGGLLLLEGRL